MGAGYIDYKFFGGDHVYNYPTPVETKVYFPTYQKVPYDPEGTLGSLTSIFMVYLGLQAGKVFSFYKSPMTRLKYLLAGCISVCIVGIPLATIGLRYDDALGKVGEAILPINKNLWTPSFVLILSGMAYFILGIFYFLIDMKNIWDGAPFYFVGRNSILIYLLHIIAGYRIPAGWEPVYPDHSEELLTAVMACICFTVYAYWVFKRNFFLVV